MACPTGRCGSDVRSIFGDIVDDLGVASDILVGGEADIIQGHTQLLVDLTANNYVMTPNSILFGVIT